MATQIIKLSPAENMLLNVAASEYEQALAQVEAIKNQRLLSVLQSHGIDPKGSYQFDRDKDGFVLVVEVPDITPPKADTADVVGPTKPVPLGN